MKKLILMAGVATLAACQPAAEEEAVDETATAEASAEEGMAGTYDVTLADGSTASSVINADGTYTSTAPDGSTQSGTVKVVNEQTCFSSAEEGAAPECWTDGEPAEDGSWVATSDEGVSVTINKRADDAAPAAE